MQNDNFKEKYGTNDEALYAIRLEEISNLKGAIRKSLIDIANKNNSKVLQKIQEVKKENRQT